MDFCLWLISCMDTLGLFSHCQILCEYYASQTVPCDFVIPPQKKKGHNSGKIYRGDKSTRVTLYSHQNNTHNTFDMHATKHIILCAHDVRQCMSS